MIAQSVGYSAEAFLNKPHDSSVILQIAKALTVQERPLEAAVFYRMAISLKSDLVGARLGLALTMADLGDYADADLHYNYILSMDPLHWFARIGLGMSLVDQGRTIEALQQAEILVGSENAAGFPHQSLGILLARAGSPDGARICFERHLADNPSDEDDAMMLLAAVGGTLPQRASDQQINRLYEVRSRQWDRRSAASTGYRGHRFIAQALDDLNVPNIKTVVDVGCGTGLVGELLRSKADRLIGVDLSEAMLRYARVKNL